MLNPDWIRRNILTFYNLYMFCDSYFLSVMECHPDSLRRSSCSDQRTQTQIQGGETSRSFLWSGLGAPTC